MASERLSDVRLPGSAAQVCLSQVDAMSDNALKMLGLARASWDAMSRRDKLMRLAELSVVLLNDADERSRD